MIRLTRNILIATGVLCMTAAPAAAAVVTHALNLRTGPGLNHQVITAMPAGARVGTGNCSGSWCQVNWRGYSGWASAKYIRDEGRTTQRAPRYRRGGPSIRFGYDRYDRYDPWYDRPFWRRPGIGFRLDL